MSLNLRIKKTFADVEITETGDNMVITMPGYDNIVITKFVPAWLEDDTLDYLVKVIEKTRRIAGDDPKPEVVKIAGVADIDNQNAMVVDSSVENSSGITVEPGEHGASGDKLSPVAKLAKSILDRKEEVKGFKCPDCEFSGITKKGLAMHVMRKHKYQDNKQAVESLKEAINK